MTRRQSAEGKKSVGALKWQAAAKVKSQLDRAVVTALGTPPVTTPTFANGAQLPLGNKPGVVQAIEMEAANKDRTRPTSIRRTRRIFVFMASLYSVKLRWLSSRGRGIQVHSSHHKIAR